MPYVVKWRKDGHYLTDVFRCLGEGVAFWSEHQREALRFASAEDAKSKISEAIGAPGWKRSQIVYVRLKHRPKETT